MKRFFVNYLVIALFISMFVACSQSNERRNGAVYKSDGIEFVYVEGNDDTVMQGFYIGKFEVTQDQWQKVMGNNPSDFKSAGNLPVENVSWNDVQEFLKRLNSTTGKNYRLPTDVEWEFAAHGGTATKFCPDGCDYSGGNDLDKIAWYKSNSGERTQPVGMKAPNELGIHDMTGNVWEWCENVMVFTPRPAGDAGGPPGGGMGNPPGGAGGPPSGGMGNPPGNAGGPPSGGMGNPPGGAGMPPGGGMGNPPSERRAVRGGSWGSEVPMRLQPSFRTGDAPDYKSHYIGFRVVLP